MYTEALCELYPDGCKEQDLAIISDLTLTSGGSLFYKYQVSVKATKYIQCFNQDWTDSWSI